MKIYINISFYIALLVVITSNRISAAAELIEGDVLSNFQSIEGWSLVSSASAVQDKMKLSVVPQTTADVILINGTTKMRNAHLRTVEEYRDVAVSLEFMIPKGSNSGVYFMGRYEIQIFDSHGVETPQHSDLGGLYQQWNNKIPGKDKGIGGIPPRVNASKAPGEWQTLDIIFRAPRFNEAGKKTENARFISVHVNGTLVQENVEASGPTRAHQLRGEVATGPLYIQGDHGPIAIRSLEVEALDLSKTSSYDCEWIDLFNGENLDGWTAYKGGKGNEHSLPLDQIFQVTDGVIHVYPDAPANSPQFCANLCHDTSFSNFHLQVEYRWLEKKFAPRVKADRDAGILFHVHTNLAGVWPPSVEMQLGDGTPEANDKYVTGDLFVLGRNTRADTPSKEGVFEIGAKLERRTQRKGENLRGTTPIYAEKPIGEWNLAEVIVNESEKAEFFLNGTLVNQVFNMEFQDVDGQWKPLRTGKISVQAEWAELEYRLIRVKSLSE